MKQALAIAILLFSVASSPAQAPSPDEINKLTSLVREVKAQQVAIGQNQEKIDAQLATLGEFIRLARIYASRGGK